MKRFSIFSYKRPKSGYMRNVFKSRSPGGNLRLVPDAPRRPSAMYIEMCLLIIYLGIFRSESTNVALALTRTLCIFSYRNFQRPYLAAVSRTSRETSLNTGPVFFIAEPWLQ